MTEPARSSSDFQSGWTGGQYSLFRVLLGLWVFGAFAIWLPASGSLAGALPADGVQSVQQLVGLPNIFSAVGPSVAKALVVLGMLLSLVLAAGRFDRLAVVPLWYLWDSIYTINPELAGPAMPRVGWLLLVHLCVPPAPFGSLAAMGRVDPRGGWRMTPGAYFAGWLLLASGYFLAGSAWAFEAWHVSKGEIVGGELGEIAQNEPLPQGVLLVSLAAAAAFGLLFGPLALMRKIRPWIWLAGLAAQRVAACLGSHVEMRLGLMLAHLFVFDPAWIGPRRSRTGAASGQDQLGPFKAGVQEHLFYDGHCGLCHRFVRVVLSEDRSGAFRLAPLDSDAFRAAVSPEEREKLPDSTVVRTADGQLLTRSTGVLYVLARLGGLWRVLSWLGRLAPRGVADVVYGGIASVRRRLFSPPAGACPILPPDLRARFDY